MPKRLKDRSSDLIIFNDQFFASFQYLLFKINDRQQELEARSESLVVQAKEPDQIADIIKAESRLVIVYFTAKWCGNGENYKFNGEF